MTRRLQSMLWVFCAVLLLAQSVLPASALARVSVRCVGAPATSPACAEAVLPAAETARAETHLAPMSCCRHMRGPCPMTGMGGARAGALPPSAALSALPCRVSVTPLSAAPTAVLTHVRPWMRAAAPALAPPVTARVTSLPVACVRLRPAHAVWSPPDRSPRSHGLRAPPVS